MGSCLDASAGWGVSPENDDLAGARRPGASGLGVGFGGREGGSSREGGGREWGGGQRHKMLWGALYGEEG